MSITRRSSLGTEDTNISVDSFGGDHWKVLLMVDASIAENDGLIQIPRLRLTYSKRESFPTARGGNFEYPTQIKASTQVRGDGSFGVLKVQGHDDIDCLSDLEREGLIDADVPHVENDHFIDSKGEIVLNDKGEPLSPYSVPEELEKFILQHTRWSLTEYGDVIIDQLRAYRDSKKPLHSFVPLV